MARVTIHLSREDVLKMICEKFNIAFERRPCDPNKPIVTYLPEDAIISWESSLEK